METIKGNEAIKRAELLCKTGGDFHLVFFPYSISRETPDKVQLRKCEHCTTRLQLPHDKFSVDGKHFFLFMTDDQKPRSCWKSLIRYMAFSNDNYKLYKLIWHE